MLPAALDFNGDMDEFLVLTKQFPVSLHGYRVVGHDTDDGGELARPGDCPASVSMTEYQTWGC